MKQNIFSRGAAGLAVLWLLAVQAEGATPFFTNAPINVARASHTATLLSNGKILVAGGYNGTSQLASSEVYDPGTGTATTNGGLANGRMYHTATLLPNGKVLVAGGLQTTNTMGPATLVPLASAELYDPGSNVWTTTGSMNLPHVWHTATLLPNGKVLVTGGDFTEFYTTNEAEIYDPASGAWTMTSPMTAARSQHTATLLADGTVLVAGGNVLGGAVLASAEIYDPVAGSWAATGSLNTNHYGQSATRLEDGRVLLAGGINNNTLTASNLITAEIYDPGTKMWGLTGSMNGPHASAPSILIPSGKVLVTGGGIGTTNFTVTNTAEVYDPTAATWTVIGRMNTARGAHTATQLPGGEVVLIGGGAGTNSLSSVETCEPTNGNWTTVGALNLGRYQQTMTLLTNGMVLAAGGHGNSVNTPTNCELYNWGTSNWTITGGLNTPRYSHTATLLESGQVLVTGGYNGTTVFTNTEIYNAGSGVWTMTNGLNTARELHTATLLLNGEVLVAGGYSGSAYLTNTELFVPANGVWTMTGGLHTGRGFHTATLLLNGKVLVTGGEGANNVIFSSVETYDPGTGLWTTNNPMKYARVNHTATLLESGQVLVTGGFNNSNDWLTNAELYNPSSGTWTQTGSMNFGRENHTATLLNDGRVLVAAGFSMSTAQKSAEVYDPATGVWVATNSLNVGRYEAGAAILPNGNVLVAGGITIPGNDSDSEVFDTGLNYSNVWQPQVTNVVSPPALGPAVILGGALFRGGSEGSGGNGCLDSAADYPLVQLRALESGETLFLTVTNWTTNMLTTVPLTNFPQGWALMTVFVDGIPSQSAIVNVTREIATVTLSGLAQYYDGTTKSVTVTTTPAGLSVSLTYNGSSAAPTNVGSYTVVATVNDTNWLGGTTNTLVISLPPRNFGMDVSHYQDSNGIPETNWTMMYTNGNRFVFCKASEGLTGPDDPTMATNVSNARAAGFLVGVYHFAHPENRPTTNGAVVEADHLLSYAGSAIGPGMLRPVLDIETGAGVLSPTQMSDWVLAFSQEVVRNRGGGAAPIVYCLQNYANTNFDSQVATNALWLEAGGGGNPAYSNPPANGFTNATGVFNNWAFWQYNISGSAGGISPIDLDVCHDELAPLSAYVIPAAAGGFKFQSVAYNGGVGFQLSFTNVPGTHFTLVSSTNVALALSNWTVVAMASEISPGQFQLTDAGATNLSLRFYRVRSP